MPEEGGTTTGTETTVATFHEAFYAAHRSGGTWYATRWLGVPIWKNPLDLWIYQEILHDVRPELIVETGTAFGGSALYLAHLCDLLRWGEVISVDVKGQPGRPKHARLSYVLGSSVDPGIVAGIAEQARGRRTLVILDSDHSRAHVLAELAAYAPLVSPGSYMIVEDTNVNGHPVLPDFGPGPWEAVEEFLATEPGKAFEVDARCEKLLMTFNPRGYLRRRS